MNIVSHSLPAWSRAKVALAATIAIILSGGCRTVPMSEEPEAEANWPRIAFAAPVNGAPGFTISIPPGLVRRPPEGPLIDFAGEDISIRIDYGPTYEQPTCRAPRCTIHHLKIDGREARMFGVDIYNPGSPYTRRTWFLVNVTGRTSLALDVACARGAACARAERIVRTIEFQSRPNSR